MRQCLLALSGVLLQATASLAMSMNGSSVFFEERPALVAIDRSIVGLKSDFGKSSKWINASGARNKLGSDFSEKVFTADGVVERHFEVEASYSQFTPYWGYGVTSHWSIYAAVPITHVSSQARARYESGAMHLTEINAQKVFEGRDRSGLRAPISDQEDTVVGQFYFVNQIDLLRNADKEVVLLQKLRVPTGEHDSLDYYTNGSPDPSGYGLEFGVLSNFDGPHLLQFLVGAKGSIYFEDSIYGYARESRSTDKPQKFRRDPGETVETTVGLEREVLFTNIIVGADYSYVRNFGDEIEGSALAFTESSEAHVLRTALAYRPPTYLSRGSYAEQIYSGRVIYSQVLDGRNVAEYQSLGVEISVNY